MRRRVLLAGGGISMVATGARAQDPAAALARLFGQVPASPDWFTPAFLAAVPLDRLVGIVDGLKRQHGAVRSVADEHGSLIVRLDRADIPTQLTLDPQGRIAGLFFGAAIPAVTGLSDAAGIIAALPGQTAVLVTTDGQSRAEHAADMPLAVGSAFKLAVLRAVAIACDDGRLAWDRVVPLEPAWRSLPSGMLQDWPERTPLTVATLTNLMISVSDNTAADALIHLAGRDAVGTLTPRNVPFLTMREFFTLKARANAALRERWARGDAAARNAVLLALAGLPLPRPGELEPGVTPGVEWFFTAREQAALLDATRGLPALGINKGPVEPGPWQAVAYKGGSEPGVLNYSALLTAENGRRHCVVVTWNNTEELDEQRLTGPFRALARTLGQEG